MTTDVPASFEEYAAGRSDARFSGWLRERAEPAWTAATTHRFTRELADDTLDDRVFERYLLQDYAFVDALVGLVGYAVGQAPSMDAKAELTTFLGTLTSEENDYFERSFDALGVPRDEWADPVESRITREFRTLLSYAAREGDYEETLAVLVPAEWIYLSWATAAADGDPPDRFYLAEWIDLHAIPEFETFVGWLRDQLDEYGPELGPRRQRRVDELFRYTVDLEVAFFDATYRGGDTTDESTDGGDDRW